MMTSAPVLLSGETLKAWRKSQRESLHNFTDAATQRLVKEIVDFEREVKRQQELQEAKFAAGMTKLEYRIEAAADLERRLAERLAALKDHRPVGIDDVRPVVKDYVEQILAGWDRPKDGTSVTVKDVEPVLRDMVAAAIAQLRAEHQQFRSAHAWTPPQRTRWPQSGPIVDVDVEVDNTPRPLLIEQITDAVKLLRKPMTAEATA